MTELLFATSNKHKFAEAAEILGKEKVQVSHFQFDYNEIRSDDIEAIAMDAVKAAFKKTKQPVFVEDTGLFIRALNGFPGTYSGWAFKKIGAEGILRLMTNMTNRDAEFRTCIAYHDGETVQTFMGTCPGSISETPRGTSGFGYDPIFIPTGKTITFAEGIDLKNTLSHRYKALRAFATYVTLK